MSIDFEKASQERDRKLRGLILFALKHQLGKSPSGGLSGPALINLVQASNVETGLDVEGDEHAVRLIQELALRKYIETETAPRRQGEKFRTRHFASVKITAKGCDLLAWDIAPDPQVNDGRATD